MSSAGEDIKAARTERGMRQDDLAAQLKVPRSFISHMESGKAKVPIKKAGVIAEVLGLDKRAFTAKVRRERQEVVLTLAGTGQLDPHLAHVHDETIKHGVAEFLELHSPGDTASWEVTVGAFLHLYDQLARAVAEGADLKGLLEILRVSEDVYRSSVMLQAFIAYVAVLATLDEKRDVALFGLGEVIGTAVEALEKYVPSRKLAKELTEHVGRTVRVARIPAALGAPVL